MENRCIATYCTYMSWPTLIVRGRDYPKQKISYRMMDFVQKQQLHFSKTATLLDPAINVPQLRMNLVSDAHTSTLNCVE